MKFGKQPVSFRHHDALSKISWEAFERLIADHYRDEGFDVDHCGTGGSQSRYDGGIDLKLRKGDEYILVQCKHTNAFKITHNDVHQLLGIMVNQGATGAIVVTSGEFTRAALEAGTKQGHVRLIDGVELRELLSDRLKLLREQVVAEPDERIHSAEPSWKANEFEQRSHSPRSRKGRSESLHRVIIKFVASAAVILFVLFAVPAIFKARIDALFPKPAPARPASITREPEASPRTKDPLATIPTADQVSPLKTEPLSPLEQERRDAETQRVLDHMNVPEVTHYRYSPLDQNKDPDPSQTGSEPPQQ